MLMRAFREHLVDRYGIDEVAQWYFEVWNEPNIDFWDGIPSSDRTSSCTTHTARALKSVSPRLARWRAGNGGGALGPRFSEHARPDHVPVDFVSTHGYADDSVEDMFGTQ